MFKKLQIILSITTILLVLIVSCAPKPTPSPPAPPIVEEVVEPAEVPATGEASVDEVAADISDSSNVDEELDTSELDDVDSILADIENI